MDAIDTEAVRAALGPIQVWVLPALLGLGLASATGLRTFLPLLMLGIAARFDLFGVRLIEQMDWIGSTPALVALAIATIVEFSADKIPAVDHVLNAVGFVTRPIAGAVAAGSVFWAVDPTLAAVAGLIVGAPAAMAFNAAQGGVRVASTATTAGLGNPVVSFIEDVLSFVMSFLALLAPLLVPVILVVLAVVVFRLAKRLRDGADPAPDPI